MDTKSKAEKILKIFRVPSSAHFMDHLSLLEHATATSPPGNEALVCVPSVADQQLPDIYLRTKNDQKIERFVSLNSGGNIQQEVFQAALEIIDDVDFETSYTPLLPQENQRMLEKLINQYYSTRS